MTYILFNPLANNSTGKEIALKLQHDRFPEAELTDLVGLDVNAFLDGLSADDDIILCGGDGTLSRFADDVYGRVMHFRRVWLASAMKGRYYGGGMMVAPAQDRTSGVMSCIVMHDSGRLHTLAVFPGIFSGSHVKHKKIVTVLTGKEITVEFDRPTALQIDGDTVRGVRKYTAKMPD